MCGQLYVYFLLIVFSLSGTQVAAQRIVFQDRSFEQSLALAKQEGKPVLIDFYAAWCGPCKQLETTVFVDPEVKAYYDKHFVCVRVDVDKEPKLAHKYQVKSIPTLIFLNSKGKEVKRVGMVYIKRFLHLGQEVTGERPAFGELYKQYREGRNDLLFLQELLLDAPDFIREYKQEDRGKWKDRMFKMFNDYLQLKSLKNMINETDFQILMLYCNHAERNDSILNFVNTHLREFEQVVKPHFVWEFIISMQNGLIYSLAKAGDMAYLEELKRIRGDMNEVYSKIKHTKLSIYEAIKSQADGNYALYAEKNESKFLDLKENYFLHMGDSLSFNDYQRAIRELVEAREGNLQSQTFERCLIWLDKASQLNLTTREQIQVCCLMGNCFHGLKNIEKAKACFNQAYVLAMQIGDERLQMKIKGSLEFME